jgi:LysR family glycine cleavage system transcriptional activator
LRGGVDIHPNQLPPARLSIDRRDDVVRAVGAVREQRSRHVVTLSVAPSFASRWLLPRLPAFERGYPRVDYQF